MTVKAEQPVVRVPVPAGLREAYLITRYDPRTVTIIAMIAIDRDRPRRSGRQEQTEGPLWINLARNAAGVHPISKRTIATICGERLGTTKVQSVRHTFARTLEDAGVKVSAIQQILGHQDLGTTGRSLARLRTQRVPHLDRVAARYGLQG